MKEKKGPTRETRRRERRGQASKGGWKAEQIGAVSIAPLERGGDHPQPLPL